MSAAKKPKLFHRLIWLTGSAGGLFVLLFFLMTVVVEEQLEALSLHHWLDAEASLYERDYRLYAEQGRHPNHYKFDLYRSGSQLPAWLSSYQDPGFYEHQLGPEDKHFLIRPHPSGQGLFYLVFKDDADDYLDNYEQQLHVSAVALGLCISLLMFGFGFYLVWQITSPLNKVLAKIPNMAPDQADFAPDSAYNEFALIEQSLLDSKRSIAGYFRREQDFSRFVAHEIRTPLTVLQGSADLLLQLEPTTAPAAKASQRIRDACTEIQLLTNTFLLLGQERIDAHHYQALNLRKLCAEQAAQIHSCHPQGNIQLHLQLAPAIWLSAPHNFVVVVLNNLLKNAFSYAASRIEIQLGKDCLCIRNDRHKSNLSEGYGYGLAIIERICDRLNWPVSVASSATEFEVRIQLSSLLLGGQSKIPQP